MKHNHIQFLAVGSILVILSACAPAQVQVLSTQTNTAAIEPTIAPARVTTILATSTAELMCPEINTDIQFNLTRESKEFEASILDYLNRGGDPIKLQSKSAPPEVPPFYSVSADLDGDSLTEVVVSMPYSLENPATIRIYHCGQNEYQLVKSFTRQDMALGVTEFVTNIFPSEPSFLIIRALHITGWGQDFFAVGWHNSEWRLISLGTGFHPSEIAFFDQNMDGIKEVFLKTTTAATPGGGRSRPIIDVFSWNGKGFMLVSSVMPPGSDRVHYLQDAESAWEDGNPLLAISYYEIAARDSSLSSYWTTYELGTSQTALAAPYQQAFAFFRIIATWFYLDRPDLASEYIQEMSEAFPKGEPGNEFVLAAQAISDSYEKEPDFTNSCAQAVNLLNTEYPDVVRNHLGDWGVANPVYSATSDICEFK